MPLLKKKILINNLINSLRDVEINKLTQKEINYFKNKKVLITGVSGVIGLNLLFTLSLNKKLNISIDGIYKTSLFDFVINYFKNDKKINFFKIDLANKKIKNKKKYDIVFHCAGYAQPSKFLKYKDSTYKLNSSAIMNLKDNLRRNSKFVYLSSTEIYSGNPIICKENDIGATSTIHPRSAYIDSKKFGESYIINFFKNYLIFRACLVYGVGAKMNDERVLNQVIIRSLKKKKIDIYGGLKQLRSNLYVSDAIILILKATSKFRNQIFNLNNNKFDTLHNIFKLISRISNKNLLYHKQKLSGSPNIIRISNKKILDLLKYKISISLKEGLIKTRNWYKNLILLK